MKIDKLVFGWYETEDFKGSTVKVLSFNHTTDEAFHEDCKRQVNELIANGAKHLSILRIANDEDLRGNNNVLS